MGRFVPEDKAIPLHLSYQEPTQGGVHRYSSFVGLIRDARESTGRDPGTGEVKDPRRCGNWLGALGYMVLLDQIGRCFKPKNAPTVSGNRFVRALVYFSNLPRPAIDALYALRCSFAHDYSLYNQHKDSSLQHRFWLVANDRDPVVTAPQRPWNGDLNNAGSLVITTVNTWAFGDLVENVALTLFQLANAGMVECTLPGGTDELLQRYSLWQRVLGP
jgi:hypothetical protein